MKRILFLTNSLVGGGAERVVLTLAEAMQSMGCYVHVILMQDLVEYEVPFPLPIDVLRLKKRSFTNGKKLKKLVDSVEQEKGVFDLVLSNLPETDQVVKKIKHSNTFYVIHTTFSKVYIEKKGILKRLRRLWRYRRLYDGENIITVSKGAEDDFMNKMKIKPKSIQTIHNPIDYDRIIQKSADATVSIPTGNYIVHVGNYGSYKRHDVLIKAYKQSGIDADLVLVGNNVYTNVKNLLDEMNLEEKVICTGFIANPYPVIKNAKILVMSSEVEGFSMVIPEALALGVEVISTDCESGPREILTGDLANNLVPVNDIQLMAEKIKELYTRIQTSTNSNFSFYVEPFNSKTIALKYLNLLKSTDS